MSDDLESLLDAVNAAANRHALLAEALHAPFGLSAGMRSLLLLLAGGEALTLSEIAERRAVSRQFIQKLATPLIAQGLLLAEPNPRHKRSPKLRLSDWGQRIVAKLRQREAAAHGAILAALPAEARAQTRSALETLAAALAAAMPDSPPAENKARRAAR